MEFRQENRGNQDLYLVKTEGAGERSKEEVLSGLLWSGVQEEWGEEV
ncbi:hypothetical protein [Pseudoflavonifractor sp. 524-17]|nr:hypothetical protein [Pseudoflavonifractor sp. 524-17]